ncbi:hypothetical protein [Burkholderia gladioli]|uniref:hypothetical protein n=1 Tax=Burkholderia gladioli TaxID=28095 RepID=UPI0011D1A7F0|nr:hypothetical protein [Burkholderia gladioli]MBW5283841.1 hypothetical protein [Burkholderia gladioli]
MLIVILLSPVAYYRNAGAGFHLQREIRPAHAVLPRRKNRDANAVGRDRAIPLELRRLMVVYLVCIFLNGTQSAYRAGEIFLISSGPRIREGGGKCLPSLRLGGDSGLRRMSRRIRAGNCVANANECRSGNRIVFQGFFNRIGKSNADRRIATTMIPIGIHLTPDFGY